MFTVLRVEGDAAHNEARSLVRSVYIREGYTQKDAPEHTGVHAYIGRDGVDTFCAFYSDTLLGTISLAREVIPMESMYADEINTLRKSDTRFAEVCQFAVDTPAIHSSIQSGGGAFAELDVMVHLLGHVLGHASSQGIKTLCFVVNPKHTSFYESLGCTPIGSEKSYAHVNGAPARAYILPLNVTESPRQHFLARKIWSIAEGAA